MVYMYLDDHIIMCAKAQYFSCVAMCAVILLKFIYLFIYLLDSFIHF